MLEIPALRTEFSKTYSLGKDKRRTVASARPIHFDAGGSWEEIDHHYTHDARGKHYRRLPYILDITPGGNARISGRDRSFAIAIDNYVDYPLYPQMDVCEEGLKTLMTIPAPELIPGEFRVRVRTKGIDIVEDLTARHTVIDETGEEPTITATHPGAFILKKRSDGAPIMTLTAPFLIDAAGEQHHLLMDIVDRTDDRIELNVILPRNWLTDSRRQYPILLDPTYTSGLATVNNTSSTSHTTPADITITQAKCRWKGKSTWSTKSNTRTGGAQSSVGASPRSVTGSIPSLSAGETFSSGYKQYWGDNYSGETTSLTLSGVKTCSSVGNGGYCYQNVSIGSGSCGTSFACTVYTGNGGNCRAVAGGSVTYTYQSENKTTNPKVVIGSSSTQHSAAVNNNVYTSYYTLNGFHVGTNAMNHTISGSGTAYFEFFYDYEYNRPTPIGKVTVQYGGVGYDLAVCALGDEGLESTKVRVRLPGGVTGAADLVSTSDSERSKVRVCIASGQIKAWRRYIS